MTMVLIGKNGCLKQMNKKENIVVITGSSGRIGTHLAARLHEKYQIIGLDAIEPKNHDHLEDFLQVDLSSDTHVKNAFRYIADHYGKQITSFIHLAAYYSFSDSDSILYDEITVKGTKRVIDALQEFHVDQFVFSSTMLVHQPSYQGELINEKSPLKPSWNYPRSKVQAEEIIHQHRNEIPSVILRIAGCYDEMCHSIPISNQIQRIYEKQLTSRVFPGDIDHGVPFLHLDDLVHAIECVIEKRKELIEESVFLIAESETMSYDELQKLISLLLFDKVFKTHRVPKWFAKVGAWAQDNLPLLEESFIKPWMIDIADEHYAIEIKKAREILNWEPKNSLRKTLPKMIELLKEDPIYFYQTNFLKIPSWIKRRNKEGSLHAGARK